MTRFSLAANTTSSITLGATLFLSLPFPAKPMLAVVRLNGSPAPSLFEVQSMGLCSCRDGSHNVHMVTLVCDDIVILGVTVPYYRAIIDNVRVSGIADFTSWPARFDH